MCTCNSDTKTRIFTAALGLFAAHGYENVSIKNIANAVSIKAASIYNHYAGKEEILNACYNYYIERRHSSRLTEEQYEPILRDGSKNDVMEVLNYRFPASILENMISSLLIIFSRIYNDKKAKEIYTDDINCSIKYMQDFFCLGVKVGRFHEFDIPAVSLILLSARLFVAQSVTIRPEQSKEWSMAEKNIFNSLLNMIPFKY